MDWLTFIATVIQALAWPVMALIIFLVIRRPLVELIPLLRRLRFMELELDFRQQVQALAVQARSELPGSLSGAEKGGQISPQLAELAQLSPRAVVLEAWLELESAAIEASRRHGLNLTSRQAQSPILLGQALEEAGILSETMRSIFHRLRNLRNAAAHASEFAFDPDSALEYADLAAMLAGYLRRV
jgi:hypothetical protein